METVKLTFELDLEAIKSTAFLMGAKLTEEHLQQLSEKELVINNNDKILKDKQTVITLSLIALSQLDE